MVWLVATLGEAMRRCVSQVPDRVTSHRVTSHGAARILGEGWPLTLIFFPWRLLLKTEWRKGQGRAGGESES